MASSEFRPEGRSSGGAGKLERRPSLLRLVIEEERQDGGVADGGAMGIPPPPPRPPCAAGAEPAVGKGLRVASCTDPSTKAPPLGGRYPRPRYYGPLRRPPSTGPVPRGRSVGGHTPLSRRTSRVAPLSLPTCPRHYPGGPRRSDGSWRGHDSRPASAFPFAPQGRPPHLFVSRLARRSLTLRPVGLPSRLAAALFIRSFSRFVASSTVPMATGRNNLTSRAGLSPAGKPAHGE